MTNNSEKLKNFVTNQNIRFVNYEEFSDIKKFDKGGFGVIKKAKWNNGGVMVALKHIKREVYSDETVIRNFIRELKHLYTIGYHPNINQLYGVTQG
ncbi:5990_t:CDS:2 [Cetraspora pellucida]|uniref:5990_t:CDS:1 n=1 Tax=Cetraspora pellucida TaxID=1433469 RepID=A0A9N9CIE6_9GLOM|nr:5990_t:CDS:2 [Cetraspora pellucida]